MPGKIPDEPSCFKALSFTFDQDTHIFMAYTEWMQNFNLTGQTDVPFSLRESLSDCVWTMTEGSLDICLDLSYEMSLSQTNK